MFLLYFQHKIVLVAFLSVKTVPGIPSVSVFTIPSDIRHAIHEDRPLDRTVKFTDETCCLKRLSEGTLLKEVNLLAYNPLKMLVKELLHYRV